jgi:hypothetical protein
MLRSRDGRRANQRASGVGFCARQLRKALRAGCDLVSHFNVIWVVQPRSQKYVAFRRTVSRAILTPSCSDKRGGSRVVTNAERDAVDAEASGAKRCSQGGYP